MLYTMLVAIARRFAGERQKELATEIKDAPAGAKTLANHILKGTKPYPIGEPIDIHFAASRPCGWWTSAANCATRPPALTLSGAWRHCWMKLQSFESPSTYPS